MIDPRSEHATCPEAEVGTKSSHTVHYGSIPKDFNSGSRSTDKNSAEWITVLSEYKYHGVTRLYQEVQIGNEFFSPNDIEYNSQTTNLGPHSPLPYRASLATNEKKGTAIFTDGLLITGSDFSGILYRKGWSLYTWASGTFSAFLSTAYQAELSAICLATHWLIWNNISTATIYTDSQSSVRALTDKFYRSALVERAIKIWSMRTITICTFWVVTFIRAILNNMGFLAADTVRG